MMSRKSPPSEHLLVKQLFGFLNEDLERENFSFFGQNIILSYLFTYILIKREKLSKISLFFKKNGNLPFLHITVTLTQNFIIKCIYM